MNNEKLIELWRMTEEMLKQQVVIDKPTTPNVEGIMVPGNRADAIAHIIIARIIDQLAWNAKDETGKPLSHLRLHEIAAMMVPDVVSAAKRLKRRGIDTA